MSHDCEDDGHRDDDTDAGHRDDGKDDGRRDDCNNAGHCDDGDDGANICFASKTLKIQTIKYNSLLKIC